MTTEIILTLSNIGNMPNFADRLRCYEQAFSISDEVLLSNPKIVNTEWVFHFVKDVFENLESDEQRVQLWCYNQFGRLFADLDFMIDTKVKQGAQIYEKLAAWLMKDGIQIMTKCIKHNLSGPGEKALAAWGIAIKLMSQLILQSTERTNLFVSIFPIAIRSPHKEVIKEAFRTWKILLKVFTTDPNWQSTSDSERGSKINNRLDLIMKALIFACNKNIIDASSEVFDCWWFCCISLGPRLTLHFENIAHRLLRYCVGGTTEYKSLNEPIDQIIAVVSRPLGNSLVSLKNQKLDNKESYAKLAEVKELQDRLLDLLESLIMGQETVFNNPVVLKEHGVYALQCVRFCDQKGENKTVDEYRRISNLFIDLLRKIIDSTLSPEERVIQMVLYFAQFTTWLQETTSPLEELSKCYAQVVELEPFKLLAEINPTQDFSHYAEEFKAKLSEFEEKILPEKLDELFGEQQNGMDQEGQPATLEFAIEEDNLLSPIVEETTAEINKSTNSQMDTARFFAQIDQQIIQQKPILEVGPTMKELAEEKMEEETTFGEADEFNTTNKNEEELQIAKLQPSQSRSNEDKLLIVEEDEESAQVDSTNNEEFAANEDKQENVQKDKEIESSVDVTAIDINKEEEKQRPLRPQPNEEERATEQNLEWQEVERDDEQGGAAVMNGSSQHDSAILARAKSVPIPRPMNTPNKPPMTPDTKRTNSRTAASDTRGILRKVDSPASNKTRRVQFNVETCNETPTKKAPFRSSPHPQKRYMDDSMNEIISRALHGSTNDDSATVEAECSPPKRSTPSSTHEVTSTMNAFGREWPIRQRTAPIIVTPHRMGGSGSGRKGRPRKSLVQSPNRSAPELFARSPSLPAVVFPSPLPASEQSSMVSGSGSKTPSQNETGTSEMQHQPPSESKTSKKAEEQMEAMERAMDSILTKTRQKMETAFEQILGQSKQEMRDAMRQVLGLGGSNNHGDGDVQTNG